MMLEREIGDGYPANAPVFRSVPFRRGTLELDKDLDGFIMASRANAFPSDAVGEGPRPPRAQQPPRGNHR